MVQSNNRLTTGLLVIGALAAFATSLFLAGVDPWLVMAWSAVATGGAVLVMAVWSRVARVVLMSMVAGALIAAGLATLVTWSQARGTGWEELMIVVGVMFGGAVGALAGALGGWLWSLKRAG